MVGIGGVLGWSVFVVGVFNFYYFVFIICSLGFYLWMVWVVSWVLKFNIVLCIIFMYFCMFN